MPQLDVKSSTVNKAIDLTGGFLNRLVGPAIDEVGQLLADQVKSWKFKNQLTRLKGAQEKIEKAGLSVKQVNLKFLFPWLEGAALESDPELQEMWENLLVNYVDPAKKLEATVFPTILSQLSSEEVQILKFLPRDLGDFATLDDGRTLAVDPVAFDNLNRLGLIQRLDSGVFIEMEGEKVLAMEVGVIRKGDYTLTVFGRALFKACQR